MRWSEISRGALTEVSLSGRGAPVEWQSRTDKQWKGLACVGDRQIEIFCVRRSGSFGRRAAWRVDFRKANWPDRRGTVGETTGILASVAAAVGEFLDAEEPDLLEMSPTNVSREKLYRAALRRMMPKIEHLYSLEEKSYGTLFGEFILRRHPGV